MARVLIDLRMVRGRLHGIARYALELARRIPRLAPDWEFVGLTDPQGLPTDLGALTPEIPLMACKAPFLSPVEQPALLASLLASRCDLFHATSFSLPALWPGRLVATLHDANHLALAENYGLLQAVYYRTVVGPRARSARALITVSDFSREELARHLDVSAYRFQVIPLGVDPAFHPPPEHAVDAFKRRHGLPRSYFAAVGSTKAHKNLSVIARVAADLPQRVAVLAGPRALRELGFPSSAIELPALDDAEMPTFYGGATALLLPSRYEGFGLPALEAMASGCPVVAARAGALADVVGTHGVLVDADDVPGWRAAALRLSRDDEFRADCVARGRQRALGFSWDLCAQKTLAVFRRALGTD